MPVHHVIGPTQTAFARTEQLVEFMLLGLGTWRLLECAKDHTNIRTERTFSCVKLNVGNSLTSLFCAYFAHLELLGCVQRAV